MSGPLNINLSTDTTTTGIPGFDPNTYVKMRFADVKKDPVEGKGDKLTFIFELTEPAASNAGGTITPGQLGSKVFHTIFMYGKDTAPGQVPTWAVEKICKVLDGFLGTGDPDNKKGKPVRPAFNDQLVPTLMGQVAFLKFKNPTGDRTSQDVAELKFPGDMPQA